MSEELAWEYNNGHWSSIEDPVKATTSDKEKNYALAGYENPRYMFYPELSPYGVEFYTHNVEVDGLTCTHPYVTRVTIGGTATNLYAKTLPDFLAVLGLCTTPLNAEP
jgi:hypothetical protein